MSTHFRPRPPTPSAPPSSPIRPSTARSTIRAITPSPPPSLSEALLLEYASAGTPYGGTPGVRPKSEGFQGPGVQGLGGEVPGSGADRVMGVERSARSVSPKKRPYSTPTELASHQEDAASVGQAQTQEQKQEDNQEQGKERQDEAQGEDESDDCPDTPTPMTSSQKRSAYIPLGSSSSLTSPTQAEPSAHPRKPHHDSAGPAQPSLPYRANTHVPRKPWTFTPFPVGNETPIRYLPRGAEAAMLDSPDIPHPAYVPIEVLDPDYDPLSDGVRDSTRDTRTDTNLLLARYPDYYDTPYQGRAGTSEGYRTSGVQTQHEREYEHGARQKQSYYPGAEQEAEHEPEQAGEQQVPHPSHPKNPIPSLAPTHHISISGISQSGISNRSAGSKHSVFSTPGRDELERKKALVEADQGPFGRAVSVADLNAKRRVISGGGEEGVGRKVDATEREGCACGLGGRCAVM